MVDNLATDQALVREVALAYTCSVSARFVHLATFVAILSSYASSSRFPVISPAISVAITQFPRLNSSF